MSKPAARESCYEFALVEVEVVVAVAERVAFALQNRYLQIHFWQAE